MLCFDIEEISDSVRGSFYNVASLKVRIEVDQAAQKDITGHDD